MNQHVLVAGLPGFGKTTTLHAVLSRVARLDIPFLVIDPAKNDYRQLADLLNRQRQPCRVIRLDQRTPGFNPLAAPEGVAVHQHAGRVLAAFDAALGFTPHWRYGWFLLGRALFDAYEEAEAEGVWPTLSDLHRSLQLVVQRGRYSDRIRDDISAGLLGRIEFLAGGSAGVVLMGGATAAIDWRDLLSRPTIIELGAFAGPEERSLLFGLLLAGLVSYREANRSVTGLAHVTVLEEAHRVLGAASGTMGTELFVEAIAELRGAGEAFVISDQAPSRLHPGILKLTGSKLVHRIVDTGERRLLGESMLLDARQQEDLARLAPGRLIAYTAGATVPLLLEVTAETSTDAPAPPVLVERALAPGGYMGLACIDCPGVCQGIAGRGLAGDLPLVPTGRQPADAAQGLVRVAMPLTRDMPAPRMAAYCATAHALASQQVRSTSWLRRALVAAVAEARRPAP